MKVILDRPLAKVTMPQRPRRKCVSLKGLGALCGQEVLKVIKSHWRATVEVPLMLPLH